MNKSIHSPAVPSAPPLALRLLLMLCALAVVAQLYVPLPILPHLAQSLNISPGVAAGVVSAFGFAYAAGFLLFGPLSDRLGRRRVMVGGLVALALISAAIGWSDSAPLLLAGRVLQGFVAAAFPPVVIAYLAERGTVRERTWSIAGVSTAFLCAGLLGQVYGGAVAGRWGLGTAMLPLALVYVGTALALHWYADDRRSVAAPTSLTSFFSGYRPLGSLLGSAPLRRVYVPALLLLMSFVAFYLALDAHAAALRTHGISPLLARAIALPGFFAPLAVAAVMPRLGAQRMVVVGLSVACVGLVLCAVASAGGHVSLLLAASVVFVAGIGVAVPSLITRVAALVPAPVRRLAVALYTFVLFVGASLGPWLAHRTAQWSLPATLALLAALLGAALVYIATGRSASAQTPSLSTDKGTAMSESISQTLLADLIPATHQLTARRRVVVDGESAELTRYERQDGRNAGLDGEHFSTVVAADGRLKGFVHLSLDLLDQPLPSRERADLIARAFLQTHAPDLLADLQLHWIEPHDETIRVRQGGRSHTVTLTGMKVKMRNRADGRWFWVIVGADERPMVFERDIVWISFPGHRKTEKWLHDAWLKKRPQG